MTGRKRESPRNWWPQESREIALCLPFILRSCETILPTRRRKRGWRRRSTRSAGSSRRRLAYDGFVCSGGQLVPFGEEEGGGGGEGDPQADEDGRPDVV